MHVYVINKWRKISHLPPLEAKCNVIFLKKNRVKNDSPELVIMSGVYRRIVVIGLSDRGGM